MSPPDFEIIDAYSHCGLSKYLPIDGVKAAMREGGVSRAVLVQHLGEFDNSYLAGVIRADPEHFAGVCLVDYRKPTAIDELRGIAAEGLFRGVRLPAEAIIARPALLRAAGPTGLVVLVFAAHGVHDIAPLLTTYCIEFPDAPVVISHLGEPRLESGTLPLTALEVLKLARFPQVYLQLSGMGMFCPPPHEPLYPLIEKAVEAFGPTRILWGSNFPVLGDASAYCADLRLLLDGQLPIPAASLADIAGGNARRLWFAEAGI